MIKTLYVASLLVLLLAVGNALLESGNVQSSSAITPQMGKIKGTVIAPDEALIPEATVVIKGEQVAQKVITDSNGTYDFKLAAGIYEISTEITGWYPLRRAPFCVQPGTVTTITIAPALRVVGIALEMTKSGIREPITTLPQPQYDSFSLPHSPNAQLNLLVQLYKKRVQKGIIEYDRAAASYNALTISAKRLRFDLKTYRIEAEGSVVFEDGKRRTHAKNATIEFKEGEPIIKLAQ